MVMLPAGVWDGLQAEVDVPVDADIVLGVDGSFSGDTTAIVAVTVPKSQDDYLKPAEARVRFAIIPQANVIAVEGAKHLWVGEPMVHRVLTEITHVVAPARLPLPTEI